MAKASKRIRAESTLIADRSGNGRARVPTKVRDHLGGHVGDHFIFEEGCMKAAEDAALLGAYFIVRLERAEQKPEQEMSAKQDVATELEPLAEVVRRKQSAT
ncbi:MAG TPA: hypothetical protein VF708_19905 [Pyrinomonadaceae bacterium]